jgi:hypothetical protein
MAMAACTLGEEGLGQPRLVSAFEDARAYNLCQTSSEWRCFQSSRSLWLVCNGCRSTAKAEVRAACTRVVKYRAAWKTRRHGSTIGKQLARRADEA